MKFANPHYRNIRKSYLMLVSCGYCKKEIVKYQKVGKGNLLRMKVDRIIESEIDFTKPPRFLICPNCKEKLGTRIKSNNNKLAYRMKRSTFNTKLINK